MQIGCLGDIIFSVSSELVRTFSGAQWSFGAGYAQHKLHLSKSAPEFTGIDADSITFEMPLFAELGVNVSKELDKLDKYIRTGEAVTLVIGEKKYGEYRWVVTGRKIKMQTFDRSGNLSGATVSVSLLEYPAPPPMPMPKPVVTQVLGAVDAPPKAWAVGDSVIANGRPQYSSYGNGAPGANVTNHIGKITFLNLKSGIPYPIHVDWLGWFAESQIKRA